MTQSTAFFENRRVHERKNCLIRVDIEDIADNFFRGILRNICPDGAYIEAKQPLLTKKRELSLTIPFQKKPGSKTVPGKVAWIGKNGFGIIFSKGNISA